MNKTMIWNTYIGDFNSGEIVVHNVFNNGRFMEYCRQNARKNNDNRDEFEKQLKRDMMYCYWSKCEWEIVIDHWPHSERCHDLKVDVYDQVSLNWDLFAEYVWQHVGELKKRQSSPKTK